MVKVGLDIFRLGPDSRNMVDAVGYFSFLVEHYHVGTSVDNQLHLSIQYKLRKNILEETYTNLVEKLFDDIEDQVNKARMDAKEEDKFVIGVRGHSTRDKDQNVICCESRFRLEKDPCQRDLDFLFNHSRPEAKKYIKAAKHAVI